MPQNGNKQYLNSRFRPLHALKLVKIGRRHAPCAIYHAFVDIYADIIINKNIQQGKNVWIYALFDFLFHKSVIINQKIA